MSGESFAVIFCLLATTLHAASSCKMYRRQSGATGRRPARIAGLGEQHLLAQAGIGIAIAAILFIGDIEPATIGIKPQAAPVDAFGIGVVVYLVLLAALEFITAVCGWRARLHDAAFAVLRTVWPRERRGKPLAVIAVCALNPVVEEVIYRGILISVLGELIGNVAIAAVLSLALSLFAHLYQGLLALTTQFCFHACAIALLFSPWGLVACIGFHFAGDVVPVVTMRPAMRAWAARQRNRAAGTRRPGV